MPPGSTCEFIVVHTYEGRCAWWWVELGCWKQRLQQEGKQSFNNNAQTYPKPLRVETGAKKHRNTYLSTGRKTNRTLVKKRILCRHITDVVKSRHQNQGTLTALTAQRYAMKDWVTPRLVPTRTRPHLREHGKVGPIPVFRVRLDDVGRQNNLPSYIVVGRLVQKTRQLLSGLKRLP